MDLEEKDEHRLVRETVRRLADEVIAPRASELDRTGEYPAEAMAQLAELGLMGIPFPEEYGGSGMDSQAYAIAIEEVARGCGSTALTLSAHTSLGTNPIFIAGTEEQKRRFVPPLASGKVLGAFGLTEPTAGSDAGATRTVARRDGGNYVLNGKKVYMTNAGHAGTAIITARTSDEPGTHGITAFIVETATPGFRLGTRENKLGLRASDTWEVLLEDCRVPVENRLGGEGEGFKVFMKTLDGGRIGIGALALGLARAAHERALHYARERKTFGKPIAEHQAIAFKLADMAVRIQTSRHLIYHAAALKDAGKPFGKEAAMAKLHASEAAVQVCYDAIQVLGGYGYLHEYEVERLYRDAKLCEIGEGTSEIQRMVISRAILREAEARDPG